MKVKRTEQIWLPPDENLSRLCHLCKNLWNEANYIIKQKLEESGEWVRYKGELYHLTKSSPNFRSLPAQTPQAILKLLDKSWKAFFRSIKEWKKNPEKFKAKPNPPKYKKKNGEMVALFTNQQCKIKNGYLRFPKKAGIKPIKTRLPDDTNLREVRIIPKGVGYVCEIVYEKEVMPEEDLEPERIAGIDFGARNIVTMVNNIGKKPIVIRDDGRGIKSINQFYNREQARIRSVYDKMEIKDGVKLRKLRVKRERKVKDYAHKLSRFVVEWCVRHRIGRLVIGYNPNWKQEVELGKRNNQNFVQIPFWSIIEKIRYKAEEKGIEVILQEESHTSKCSFLDGEPVEHHDEYVGRRKTRSLFRSRSGRIIHADLNAAYNIIKKAIPGAFSSEIREWIGGCGSHPLRIRVDEFLNSYSQTPHKIPPEKSMAESRVSAISRNFWQGCRGCCGAGGI